jgi:hypothetical protein
MSRNVNFWGQGNKASVSGEERANILLLACCYQQGSRRWRMFMLSKLSSQGGNKNTIKLSASRMGTTLR